MGSDCKDRPPPHASEQTDVGPQGCCARLRVHTEDTPALWGTHSSLNSHQSWEEACQGVGDLLTVVASSVHSGPQNPVLGMGESEKRKYKG